MEPTYLLWVPRVTSDGTAVRFNVTPGSVDRWPVEDPEFYATLLADLGVDGRPVRWSADLYRASYHGPDAPVGDPRVDWKRSWRVTVHADPAPEPRVFEEVHETEAFDAGPEAPEPADVPCLVVADFATRGDADAARAAVAPEIAGGDAACETIEVDGTPPFWQLQVEVGRFPQAFYDADAPLARRIQARCRELGGWTTFEERVIGLERPKEKRKRKRR